MANTVSDVVLTFSAFVYDSHLDAREQSPDGAWYMHLILSL